MFNPLPLFGTVSKCIKTFIFLGKQFGKWAYNTLVVRKITT